MKKRDKRTKQEVRGAKQEKKVKSQDQKGNNSSSRGEKRPTLTGTTTGSSIVDRREWTKRSGVEAVKLHLQTTGGTGRTSRSATSVMYLL